MRQSPLFSADRCSFPSAPVMLRLSNDVECESGGETVPHQPIYKHNKKSQEAAHGSCGWAQPVSQQPLLTCVWQEVSAKWLCNISHRIATSYGPDCLDPFLHYHDTLIRANVDWLKFKLRQFGSICPSIKKCQVMTLECPCVTFQCGMSLKDQKMYCPICLNYEEVIKGGHGLDRLF